MPISMGAISESSPSHPGYVPNRYYLGIENAHDNSASALGLAIESVSYYPFQIKFNAIISSISVYCTTAKTNADATFGIHTNEGGMPKNLIAATGNIPIATVGLKESIISVPVVPGWYWFAGYCNVTPNLATITTNLGNNHLIGQLIPSNTIFSCGLRETFNQPLLGFPSIASISNISVLSGSLAPQFWLKFS